MAIYTPFIPYEGASKAANDRRRKHIRRFMDNLPSGYNLFGRSIVSVCLLLFMKEDRYPEVVIFGPASCTIKDHKAPARQTNHSCLSRRYLIY